MDMCAMHMQKAIAIHITNLHRMTTPNIELYIYIISNATSLA